jgi:hypothetical protein
MKITVNGVLSALQVMARLVGERRGLKFGYRVKRIYEKLLSEAKAIDSHRKDMQASFGATEKDGQVVIPPDKMQEAEKAWQAFGESETRVDCWTLPASMIEAENELARGNKWPPVSLSGADLIALGPVFDAEGMGDE